MHQSKEHIVYYKVTNLISLNNDFIVKMKQVKKFIDNGDKVKITLRFRGREMTHQALGVAVLDRVKEDTEELCKIETMPKLEGRQMVMILAPK